MVQLWNAHIADDPYSSSLIGYGDGVYVLRVYEEVPLPQEFAVATGEWINHLRSALDYTVWATAVHVSGKVPPPKQGQIQYPIYASRTEWDRNLARLDALAEHHRTMLLTVQPFNGDADASFRAWVNRIARSDRHRHLSKMAGYLAELQPALRTPAGCEATLQWGERVVYGGYADVARIVVTPWKPEMQIEFNPRMGIDPDIEEWSRSPFWSKIPFPERLRMLQAFVAADIAAFEYDATGLSRRQDLLKEAYISECDARDSKRRPWPTRERQAVEWSDPVGARRATESELSGDDFPAHGPGHPGHTRVW